MFMRGEILFLPKLKLSIFRQIKKKRTIFFSAKHGKGQLLFELFFLIIIHVRFRKYCDHYMNILYIIIEIKLLLFQIKLVV